MLKLVGIRLDYIATRKNQRVSCIHMVGFESNSSSFNFVFLKSLLEEDGSVKPIKNPILSFIPYVKIPPIFSKDGELKCSESAFYVNLEEKPEPTRRPRPSMQSPKPEWSSWSNEEPDKLWSEWSGNQWSKWSEWSDNDSGRPINTPQPLPEWTSWSGNQWSSWSGNQWSKWSEWSGNDSGRPINTPLPEWTPWSSNQWSAWSSTKPSPWSNWSSQWSKWSAWEQTMLQNNSTRVRTTTRKYPPTTTSKPSTTTTLFINVEIPGENQENEIDNTNNQKIPTVSTAFTLSLTSEPDENELADMKVRLEKNLAGSNPFPAGNVNVTIDIVEVPLRRDILKFGRKRRSTRFEARITVVFIAPVGFVEDVKTEKLSGYVLKDVQLALENSPSVDQTALLNMTPYSFLVVADLNPTGTTTKYRPTTTPKPTTRTGRVLNSTVAPPG